MPQVTVYSRTSCAPCKMLKIWLTNKGIPFVERNVDEDPSLMDQIVEKTGFRMVPVTQIGEQYIAGANIPSISKLLVL